MKDFTESIIKINAKDVNGNVFKFCTGIFYEPFNNSWNGIYFITATHFIKDDEIQSLELIYTYNSNKFVEEIQLNEYDKLDIFGSDISIIKIMKTINYNYYHKLKNIDIIDSKKDGSINFLNFNVLVPGFFDNEIINPIYENSYICSKYNKNLFYIKSKYIIEGYSGAPVFIDLQNIQTGQIEKKIIGFISRNVGNDNIEVMSAENILLATGQIEKKYNSNL